MIQSEHVHLHDIHSSVMVFHAHKTRPERSMGTSSGAHMTAEEKMCASNTEDIHYH